MSEYDGSIKFDTKIDPSGMQAGVKALKPTVMTAFASIRDVMMGPVAAGKAIIGAFKAVGAEVAKLEGAWAAQDEAIAVLNATLKATGATAWTSSKALQDMASEFQGFTKYGDETITSMQNVLLGFKNIKGDNFKDASLQILNMATVMKMDLTSAAQAVGKALDNPIEGMDSLSRQGFKFSKEQKAMLKEMVETGRIAEAQGIILDELATTYGGAAEAAGMTGSAIKERLQNAIGDVNEEIGRSITNSLAPFRMKFLELAQAIGASVKATNDFKDAMKAEAAGTATVTDKLLIEETRLASLRDARKHASGEQLKAVDASISAQEKLIEALKVQQVAEENAARFRSASAAREAAVAKDLADKAAWQAKIDEARLAIVTEYNLAVKEVNRQEAAGMISAEDAADARQSALKAQIASLVDLINTEKLGVGATTQLLDEQTAAWVRNQAAIDGSTDAAERNALKKSLYTGASDRARGGASGATGEDAGISRGGGSMLFDGLADLEDALRPLIDMFNALESVSAILNPLQTIFEGLMDVLGPVIDDMLAPLVGILEIVGQTIGQILAPALQLLTPIIEFVGKLFVALYNNLVVPVGNFIIRFFNKIYNAIAGIMNWVIDMINNTFWWAGVNVGRVATRDENAGTIAAVSYGGLTAAGGGTTASSKAADALGEANARLKENKELLTKASRAAELYGNELTAVIDTVADFYGGLQDAGREISDVLVDSLVDGLDGDDFLYALEQYITESVIQAAVFTDSFTSEVAAIGTDLAAAIAGGASEGEIASIRDRLTSLYATAAGLAQAASDTVAAAFGSYDVGALNVRGDQLANIHNGEMILPPGISEEARSAGIYIGPSGGESSIPRMPINIIMSGNIEVDGMALARVAYQYQDEIVGAAYGA